MPSKTRPHHWADLCFMPNREQRSAPAVLLEDHQGQPVDVDKRGTVDKREAIDEKEGVDKREVVDKREAEPSLELQQKRNGVGAA